MTANYTNKQKKALFEKINMLSSTEHEEILKIVKTYNVPFSRNKNGVFFNLSGVTDDVVRDIENFVIYCISNKKDLDEYDKIINECKMSNNVKLPVATTSETSTLNTSLANMGRMEPKTPVLRGGQNTHTWASVKMDEVTIEKFNKFLDRFHQDRDRIGRKKVNVKFNNAKKRFAKRANDRKIDYELGDVLVHEQVLITI